MAFPEKTEVEDKQMQAWLKEGIILEKVLLNTIHPHLVCRKKDGSMQICMNFHPSNHKKIRNHYPLPVIEEILDKLGNGWSSKLLI